MRHRPAVISVGEYKYHGSEANIHWCCKPPGATTIKLPWHRAWRHLAKLPSCQVAISNHQHHLLCRHHRHHDHHPWRHRRHYKVHPVERQLAKLPVGSSTIIHVQCSLPSLPSSSMSIAIGIMQHFKQKIINITDLQKQVENLARHYVIWNLLVANITFYATISSCVLKSMLVVNCTSYNKLNAIERSIKELNWRPRSKLYRAK